MNYCGGIICRCVGGQERIGRNSLNHPPVCGCFSDFLDGNMNQRTRDNLVYLGVAGVIVAAPAFYVFYADSTMGRIPDIPGAILWGVLSTPVIVALILEQFWKYRRRRALWIILLGVASINIAAVCVAYSWHWNPPVIVWSTMTGLWLVAVFVLTERLIVG